MCSAHGFLTEKFKVRKRLKKMEILRFENITKRYGQNTVVDNVSLSINEGEVFSLLGPSGCGTTPLLRLCGGVAPPDAGRVILDGGNLLANL